MSFDPKSYLDSLSPEQHEAAVTTDTPVAIIACAGSGKTRTLIGRAIHLMLPESMGGLGADPNSIMMVTFTNKAAREMHERIKPVLEHLRADNPQSRMSEPWIGTFHSLSLRILRVEAARAGLGPNFSIFDESDAASLAKEVAEQLELETFDVDDFFRDLELVKARLISAELMAEKNLEIYLAKMTNTPLDPMLKVWDSVIGKFKTDKFPQVYTAYQAALDEQNAVDFSDLMNRVTKLFQQNEDVRNSWRSNFRHFMADEMQDMNRAQVAWLEQLTAGGRPMVLPDDADDNRHTSAGDGLHEINGYRVRKFPNATVACVGDDDQAIYGFRGSDPTIIPLLLKRNPNMQIKYLNESYRCQPSILAVADQVVSSNSGRQDKAIRAADPTRARAPVVIERHTSPDDEVRRIIGEARNHISQGGDPAQFAILVRTRDHGKAIARQLRAHGLPVTEGKASDLRKRAEVKDAMAFASFLCNPDAEVLLRRIINKPARGLGPTQVARIGSNAKLKGINFIEEMRTIVYDRIDLPDGAQNYTKGFKSNIRDFGILIGELRSEIGGFENAALALEHVLERTGYLSMLRQDAAKAAGHKESDFAARKPREFLIELLESQSDKNKDVAELDSEDLADRAEQLSDASRRLGNIAILLEQAEPIASLQDFVQEATLEMSQNNQAAGIVVMTLHAAKGLEFDRVRMPFMIQGVLPHSRALEEDDPTALEEERRLLYVGLTRAREEVRVSTSWKLGGSFIRIRDGKASDFLAEMKQAPREAIFDVRVDQNNMAFASGLSLGPAQYVMPRNHNANFEHEKDVVDPFGQADYAGYGEPAPMSEEDYNRMMDQGTDWGAQSGGFDEEAYEAFL